MCGIVFLYRAGGATQIGPMLDAIVHRGPDDSGVQQLGETTVGARRLSIIDVPGGHQPVHNESRDIWVAYNGEIYNHVALRRALIAAGHRFVSATDTEILVHGYEEWGMEGLLGRLRGMFAFAVADGRTGRAAIARDRLGKKPLYIARAGGGWAAASEIKALFKHPSIAPVLDEDRIPESLANRFVTNGRTAFANVTKVLPGHWMSFGGGNAASHRYWSPPEETANLPDEITGEIRRRVDEAVRMRLIADVPLGTLLSGGLDSSIVAAAMRDAGASPLRTYTVGFEDAASDERAAAGAVARHLGTEHTERVVALDATAILPEAVWHLDEPMGDAATVPTLAICRVAREHVTVVLSGEGADELFLGYPRYLLSRMADRALTLPRALRRPLFDAAAALLPGRASHAIARLADAPPDALVRNALWQSGADPMTIASLTKRKPLNWEKWYVPENVPAPAGPAGLAAVLRRDLRAWLVDDVLLKVDKMSMAASLEARAPFLDHELVEFVCRLPLEARFEARGKRWLKEAFKDALPPATLARRKQPFKPPVAGWLRGQLGLELEATIGKPSSFTQRYLDRAVVKDLLEAHRRGADHALLLWSVLVHETWWRRFFEPPAVIA